MFKEKLSKFCLTYRNFIKFFTYAPPVVIGNFFLLDHLATAKVIDPQLAPIFLIFGSALAILGVFLFDPLNYLFRGLVNLSLDVNTNPFISEREELGYEQNGAFVRSVFWAMFVRKLDMNAFATSTGEHLNQVENFATFTINETYLNKLWLNRDNVTIKRNLIALFRDYFPAFEKEGFLGYFSAFQNTYLHYVLKFMLLCNDKLFFTQEDLYFFKQASNLSEERKISDVWVVDTLFSHDIYTNMPREAREYYRKIVQATLLAKYQPKLDLWEMEMSQKDFIPIEQLNQSINQATTNVEAIEKNVSEDLKLDVSYLPIHLQVKFNTLLTLCAELQAEKEHVDIQVFPDLMNIENIILPKYLDLFKTYRGTDEKFLAGLNGIEGFLMNAKEQMLIQKNSSFDTYQTFIEQKFNDYLPTEENKIPFKPLTMSQNG